MVHSTLDDKDEICAPAPVTGRASGQSRFRLIGAALLLIAVGGAVLLANRFGVELEKPLLELEDRPTSIGNEAVSVKFRASDLGSGVASVSVAVEQAGVLFPVGLFRPQGRVREFEGVFTLSQAGIPGLREGAASVRIEVKDLSVWGSTEQRSFPLVIDSRAPTLELLIAPRSIEGGGAGFFIYRAADLNLSSSGVAIGEHGEFKGVPAALFDQDLLHPDLFAVLAPAPMQRGAEWKLFASDLAGRSARLPLTVDLRAIREGSRVVSEFISEGALQRLVESLSHTATTALSEGELRHTEGLKAALANGERDAVKGYVAYLMTTVREREIDTIRDRLNASPATPRSWRGRATGESVSVRIGFGDTVSLRDDRAEFVTWFSQGETFERIGEGSAVVAPYAGVVRMAGLLGTLGEVVVVDHGAGLATVFYSLGQRHVFEGAIVSAGEVLADIGASGLHASKAVRMLLLVNGEPIDPALWRRNDGIASMVEGALHGVKGALGIESSLEQ